MDNQKKGPDSDLIDLRALATSATESSAGDLNQGPLALRPLVGSLSEHQSPNFSVALVAAPQDYRLLAECMRHVTFALQTRVSPILYAVSEKSLRWVAEKKVDGHGRLVGECDYHTIPTDEGVPCPHLHY